MKSFQLTRLNVSSYQDPTFGQKEKDSLQSLGLSYRLCQQEIDDSHLILLTNTHSKLSSSVDLLAKTKLIIHPNSGYDNIAADYELIKDIPVVIGHEIRAHAVAEWIMSAFVEATINRPQHIDWDPSRQWQRTLLKNQEVVIFGAGHIGTIVKESLNALGLKVHVIDPYTQNTLASYRSLPSQKYLALIVCCGLNQLNHQMFNQELFAHLSFDYFINGARGALVNELDLLRYLASNPHAKAFLDVFNTEPFITSEWEESPQVIRSSHIAGVYQNLDQEIIKFEFKVLNDFLHLAPAEFATKYHSQLLSSKLKEGVII